MDNKKCDGPCISREHPHKGLVEEVSVGDAFDDSRTTLNYCQQAIEDAENEGFTVRKT